MYGSNIQGKAAAREEDLACNAVERQVTASIISPCIRACLYDQLPTHYKDISLKHSQ